MPNRVRIALDAMGGDVGAAVVVPGAELSLLRHPNIEFLLFGNAAAVEPLLDAHPRLKTAARVVHTDVAVRMDDKPSQALRRGRWRSSMWLAVDAVKKHEADVAVSAGNTGALMAMAKFNLRMLAGIDRPAIAALWPTLKAVGLLNIGVEEVKGLEEVREAGRILREAKLPNLDYVGFIEGTDIGEGTVDVVVTEGFAGNIALKTAEGTARQLVGYLRNAMNRTWRARLGYALAREAFDLMREKMDPGKANGGVFLGLNGIVIKSHGGADAEGFAAAIDLGYDMVRYELIGKMSQALERKPGEVAS